MENDALKTPYFNEFLKRGVRNCDFIEITPLSGKSQKIKILYNKLSFQAGDEFKKAGDKLTLPTFQDHQFSFALEKREMNRYLFRSLDSLTPFKINGQPSIKSWVMRGDIIDFFHHKLKFKALEETENRNGELNFPLPHENILKSDLNILIQGETGTGKTTLAEKIHQESQLKGHFIHLNLESFSPGLIESELFGHVEGAFTGAHRQKKGALEMAQNGTLFLDEIDSLSKDIQCKLLIYLDKKYYYPVGSEKKKNSNARIIFASTTPIKELMNKNKMRKDFFYRMASGETLSLPSLRNKKDLISNICLQLEKEHEITISHKLIAFYKKLSWPGNIRQLRQHIYKKSLVSPNGHLTFDQYDEDLEKDEIIDEIMEERILDMKSYQYLIALKIYQKFEGHLRNSAQTLKITPTTLRTILNSRPSLLEVH